MVNRENNVNEAVETLFKQEGESDLRTRSILGEYIQQITLIILKPEAIARNIAGQILSRIEDKGLNIHILRTHYFTPEELDRFYPHIVDRPFYPRVRALMLMGPTLIGLIRGNLALTLLNGMKGHTDPLIAEPGTIRGDFAISLDEGNVIHSSENFEDFRREAGILFPDLFPEWV